MKYDKTMALLLLPRLFFLPFLIIVVALQLGEQIAFFACYGFLYPSSSPHAIHWLGQHVLRLLSSACYSRTIVETNPFQAKFRHK